MEELRSPRHRPIRTGAGRARLRRGPRLVLALAVAAILTGIVSGGPGGGPGGARDGDTARSLQSTARAADRDPPRDVSALLADVRKAHDVPGIAAVLLEGDRIAASGAAGVRRRGGKAAITVDDPFHLGSCTKAMTATLCALLVAEDHLTWDTKPTAALPRRTTAGGGTKTDAGWDAATLADLLRNRAGAPADLEADGLWRRLWAHEGPPRESRRTLTQAVLARPPVHPPGSAALYSNAGFAIAGAIAEETRDTAFEELLRSAVFRPLGMDRAGFGAPGKAGREDAPYGHRADGKPVEPGPTADNPDAIAPAGKVHAPLADWAKFITLHLRRGRGAPGALARIDFDRLHTPPAGGDYAMGWSVLERPWAKGPAPADRGRVLTHSGSNTMWFAVVWIAPEADFALLAACNQGGDAGAKACDAAVAGLLRDREATRRK